MAEDVSIVKWGTWTIAWVHSVDVSPALELARNGDVDGLGISPYNGFSSDDISFLADAPYVQGVVLPYAENYDVSILARMTSLRFITVAGSKRAIDYGAFAELEDLRIEWHSKIALPSAESRLRSLYIRRYGPKSKSLIECPAFRGLVELEINQGNLTSVEGVESLEKLDTAMLCYLRQLKSVEALKRTPITRLDIETCRKITDLPELRGCPSLESLSLRGCGTIPSLAFLREFKMLKQFCFVNTTVQDGDMTPLLGLKSAGFLKRRRYSHTPEEIKEAIARCERLRQQ